jgi:hypothetical protein
MARFLLKNPLRNSEDLVVANHFSLLFICACTDLDELLFGLDEDCSLL